MHHVRRFVVRSILALVFALAAPVVGVAAAQAGTTGTADSAGTAGMGVDLSLTDAFRYADSVATADSVRLITELLTANGAPAHRARPAAAAILKYARLNALDPLLVVGIIGVENATLAPRARSSAGARGVMQVMPHWRKDIRDCGTDLTDVVVNICFGTRILRIALDETASVRTALLRYNGCLRSRGCTAYAAAVFSRTGQAMLLSRALAPAPPAPRGAAVRAATAVAAAGGGEAARDDR